MPFDLAEALKNKKNGLKSVTTKVISIDGVESEEKRAENGEFAVVCDKSDSEDGQEQELGVSKRRMKKVERAKKMGFVIDLKPDLQVAKACEGVYLSSQDVAADFQLLKQHNIKAIVNAAAGVGNLYPKNFNYLKVDLLDLPETDILSELPDILSFMHENATSGQYVLVHCNAGVSRAGTIVLAYLIKYQKMSFTQAFDGLKVVRPALQPNAGFLKQLVEFDRFMISEYSITNISCDSYTTDKRPFVQNDNSELPVVRVFGITGTGEKCCAHIHGTSPCIWMRTNCRLSSSQKLQLSQTLSQRLRQAGMAIPTDPITEISEFNARSIYGYYENKCYFVRISFRHIKYVKIITKLLQDEAINDSNFQPYLSHIPFILQFFIEYSIFGMGMIKFKKVLFRKPPSSATTLQVSPLPPVTNVAVEFDAHVDDILNPIEEEKSDYVNSGLQYIWEDEKTRRKHMKIPSFIPPKDTERNVTVTEAEKENLLKLRRKLASTSKNVTPSQQLLNSTIFDGDLGSQNGNNDTTALNLDSEPEDDDSLGGSSENEGLSDMEQRFSSSDEEMEGNVEIVRPQNLDDFQHSGWDLPVFKPKRHDLSEKYPEKLKRDAAKRAKDRKKQDGTESTSQGSSKEKTFRYCANLNDVTIHSRLIKRKRKSVSPIKPLKRIPSLSTVNSLCVMSIELVIDPVSKARVPNPSSDPIMAISCAICTDICNWSGRRPFSFVKSIVVAGGLAYRKNEGVQLVSCEMEMLQVFCGIVQKYDPDIMIGYDLHRESWTYLAKRAEFIKYPLCSLISRLKATSMFDKMNNSIDKGRIMLEVWRIVRRDHPLRSYSYSYVVSEVLDVPVMEIGHEQFTDLADSEDSDSRLLLVELALKKAKYNIRILEELDIFVKTCQMARVYGIQFSEVLTRGSQFRVESMLLRLAKKRAMIPPAVGVKQRALMGSPETIPLNLEPESGIYRDPVVVLDFQSLYPSVCIAYNYCFSTCLGKMSRLLQDHEQDIKLGALRYTTLEPEAMYKLLKRDQIHISPTGGVFVKEIVRKSILAEMLMELLDTRVMVKDSMKKYSGDYILKRTLDAQQLALKLVANVTYGYTAANWSGRMPCEEVADAIVSKGREALERVIQMIKDNSQRYHGARVIYGDTDSVFVLFEGCTKKEAFKLGNLIADDATQGNPKPMKLKFEKVMQPCVLVTKKRYVGMSYEKEGCPGEFDAKGIETVRRDGSVFVSQMVEKCLNILFDYDHYAVIQYLRTNLSHPQKYPLSDFIINAEYRGEYSERAQVPAKKLAAERKAICERFEPVRGERLSFVIVRPEAHVKKNLIDCVVSWEDFQNNSSLQLHYNYYIGKHLMAAMKRFFDLVPCRLRYHALHFDHCPGCGKNGKSDEYCDDCCSNPHKLRIILTKNMLYERKLAKAFESCNNCVNIEALSLNFQNLHCYNSNCGTNNTKLKVLREFQTRKQIDNTFDEDVAFSTL
ncbi:unnamed protein product [Bursaphelenchus okinawaensis]|uniref:DNA polymerase n=1 Tax=Bursaphelenchus okinawaensis TaxID=465554 RepID=A0A811L694_9BILA|nr:unnamed protein product [Bursaphelenchus okinawaensis]CAG9118836.1 unnamed protein product [Bursaphelenchus okinawaensis]